MASSLGMISPKITMIGVITAVETSVTVPEEEINDESKYETTDVERILTKLFEISIVDSTHPNDLWCFSIIIADFLPFLRFLAIVERDTEEYAVSAAEKKAERNTRKINKTIIVINKVVDITPNL